MDIFDGYIIDLVTEKYITGDKWKYSGLKLYQKSCYKYIYI